MTNTDENSTSWVDDMYQKFEAVFTDTEETTYEDSVKYVEDQVKTVGARVKKLYLDVFQDLLSQSSDEPELSGLHLVHYSDNGIFDMPRVATRRRPVKVESEKQSRDSDPPLLSDERTNERLSSGSCNLTDQFELDQSKENGQGETNETDEKDGCAANNSLSEATAFDEATNDECVFKYPDGTSDETEAMRFEDQFSSVKLDESCVLVDKYECFPASHLEAKQRSHKKKIGDVLYLRRWSNGKNQKQLLQALKEEIDSSDLESGWEIV